VDRPQLRIALVRGAVALAAAQVVATALALLTDPETVGAALLATLPLVPGIVGVVVLEALRRPIAARVLYVLWLGGLLALLGTWAQQSDDGIVRMICSLLMPLLSFSGIAAWGVLRRGWPLFPRLLA